MAFTLFFPDLHVLNCCNFFETVSSCYECGDAYINRENILELVLHRCPSIIQDN